MSKVQSYGQEFLDNVGYTLGYDVNNMPDVGDIEIVWAYRVPVWEYKGMTEIEYYGGVKWLGGLQ